MDPFGSIWDHSGSVQTRKVVGSVRISFFFPGKAQKQIKVLSLFINSGQFVDKFCQFGENKSKKLRVNFLKNVQKSTFDDMNGPRRTVGQQI